MLTLDDATLAYGPKGSLQPSALNAIPDHEPTLSKHEKEFEINNLTVSYGSPFDEGSAGSTPRNPHTIGLLSFSARLGETGIIGKTAWERQLCRACAADLRNIDSTVSVDGRPFAKGGLAHSTSHAGSRLPAFLR